MSERHPTTLTFELTDWLTDAEHRALPALVGDAGSFELDELPDLTELAIEVPDDAW